VADTEDQPVALVKPPRRARRGEPVQSTADAATAAPPSAGAAAPPRSRYMPDLSDDTPERGVAVRLLHAGDRIFTRAYHHLNVLRPWPIPLGVPAIIVCNHTSPMDPLFIQSVSPRMINWMMASEYMRIPVLKWVFHTIGIIPVDRSGRDSGPLRTAMRALDRGRVLGVFPEGRIEPTRRLLPFQTGVAMMAIKAKVPVYPVYVDGTQRGQGMVAACLGPNDASITFGPPLDLTAFNARRDLQAATTQIQDAVNALRIEVDHARYGRDLLGAIPRIPALKSVP
jgi:1-acyl-sn-glycerol-3-phosphate acyltransferase